MSHEEHGRLERDDSLEVQLHKAHALLHQYASDVADLRERLDLALVENERINAERAKLTSMVGWLRARQALLGDVVRMGNVYREARRTEYAAEALSLLVDALDAHAAHDKTGG